MNLSFFLLLVLVGTISAAVGMLIARGYRRVKNRSRSPKR
jgi:hypothetical protein